MIPSNLSSSKNSTEQLSMTKKIGRIARCLVINISFVFEKLVVSWLYFTQSRNGINFWENSTKVWDKLSSKIDKVVSSANKQEYMSTEKTRSFI